MSARDGALHHRCVRPVDGGHGCGSRRTNSPPAVSWWADSGWRRGAMPVPHGPAGGTRRAAPGALPRTGTGIATWFLHVSSAEHCRTWSASHLVDSMPTPCRPRPSPGSSCHPPARARSGPPLPAALTTSARQGCDRRPMRSLTVEASGAGEWVRGHPPTRGDQCPPPPETARSWPSPTPRSSWEAATTSRPTVSTRLPASSERTSRCFWKGMVRYKDVVVDGQVNAAAAWAYLDPSDVGRRGRVHRSPPRP